MKPAPTLDATKPPEPFGPCRVCGSPSWKRDDEGPIHPCCAFFGDPCPGCAISHRRRRQWNERQEAKKRRRR